MNFNLEKAFAATGISDADTILDNINDQILNPLVTLLFVLAVFWFIWGMVRYIKNAENPSERETGYQHMIWSVIGMFIMISVKGIINLLLETLF